VIVHAGFAIHKTVTCFSVLVFIANYVFYGRTIS